MTMTARRMRVWLHSVISLCRWWFSMIDVVISLRLRLSATRTRRALTKDLVFVCRCEGREKLWKSESVKFALRAAVTAREYGLEDYAVFTELNRGTGCRISGIIAVNRSQREHIIENWRCETQEKSMDVVLDAIAARKDEVRPFVINGSCHNFCGSLRACGACRAGTCVRH
jgi:hypothetical protein